LNRPVATIRDVARASGLSVASVSRVINGLANVNAATRDKVNVAIRDLGYIPNAAARSLSTARTHALGVVLPDIHGEFFSELMRGMEQAARRRGYLLLLSNMHADPQLAGQALAAMRGRVDGLIVMAPQIEAVARESNIPRSLPTVLINSPESSDHFALRVDNRSGIFATVAHLLEGGRRAIVHLGGDPGNIDARERREAYLAAMAELAPDLPVRVLDGDFGEESGEALTRSLLAEHAPFDALVSANDMMALGAMQALRDAGIACPEQVAVTGFDDVPLARYLGLTTVGVDIAGMGVRAVDVLAALIADGNPPDPTTTELCETRLILRETTRINA